MYFSEYENINFLVGVNGSGKSRYLNKIAKEHNNYQYNVLGISNTVFDKIKNDNCKKMSANRGRYFLKKILLEVLISDRGFFEENEKVGGLFGILEYLNYDKEIHFSFKFPKNVKKKNLYDFFVEKINLNSTENF